MTTPAEDPRREPETPPEKKTTELPAVPAWAIELSQSMKRGFAETNANIDLVTGDVRSLKADVVELKAWKLQVENPSHPPPPPLTSTSVKALIDGHPSQMDLALQAAQAEQIVKDMERDKRIEETHALAITAAEKLQEQSDFMGIGKKGLAWLRSKDARSDIMQFVALVSMGYAALKAAGVLK